MNQKQRDAFEAWAKASVPYVPLTRSDAFEYSDPRAEVAWYAYQAAQAAMIANRDKDWGTNSAQDGVM